MILHLKGGVSDSQLYPLNILLKDEELIPAMIVYIDIVEHFVCKLFYYSVI